MFVGISTACFYPKETENTIEDIAPLGFKHIEVFFNSICECEEDFCAAFRGKIDSLGIACVSAHPYISSMEHFFLFSGYKRRKDDGFLLYKDIFKGAKTLGAKHITFHGDRVFLQTAFSIKQYAKVFMELDLMAKDHGLRLAQENVSWCRSCDLEFLKGLLNETGGDVCFTLDIKQAVRAQRDVFDYIKLLKNKIVNIHINDYTQDKPCLLPFEGDMDYIRLKNALVEMNYGGELIIEVYRDNFSDNADVLKSKKKLEEIYY